MPAIDARKKTIIVALSRNIEKIVLCLYIVSNQFHVTFAIRYKRNFSIYEP
jgi:hypothetical protein